LISIYNFYKDSESGVEGFWHKNIEKAGVWVNWIWGAMKGSDWEWFGGLGEFNQWGSVDLDFMHRRGVSGIVTKTFQNDSCYTIHQNHDEPGLVSDRKLEDAHAAIKILDNDNGLRPGTLEKYKNLWI